MSRVEFQLAYDGDGKSDHSMDVQYLAPALIGLGNLIREANHKINNDRSKVHVLVQSDFEHKCFNIHFEVVQSVISHITTFLHDEHVESAKTLLEWLGLVGILPSGGLIGFLKWKNGQPVKNAVILDDSTAAGDVRIEAGDGSTIVVNRNIYQLSSDSKIKEAVSAIFYPLQSADFDKVEFRDGEKPVAPSVTYTQQDAARIIASCASSEENEISYDPQTVIAHLRVHSPVFDPKAPNWRFRYGDDVIFADISETNIATDAIQRGGVFLDDLYKVKMEITEHRTQRNQFRKSYKIIEVLEFSPAARQRGLFD